MRAAIAQTVEAGELSEIVSGETTGWEWAAAAVALAGGVVLGMLVRRLLVKTTSRTGEETDATRLVARATQWLFFVVGIVVALWVLDVRMTPLLGALGIGGIALALALQPTLENVFAGMVIHAQRPLRVGEEISTGEVEGRIIDITARAVVVQSFEGERVFIPNKIVVDREVVNRVRHGRRRTTVGVGLAYDTDLRLASEVLTAAAYSAEGVLDTPPPRVFAREFGESSIDFEIDIWHRPNELTKRQVRHRVILAVHEMLAAADITIAFPQRTLWWGGADQHAPDLAAMAETAGITPTPRIDDAVVDDELTAEDLADHDQAAVDESQHGESQDGELDAGTSSAPHISG